MTRGKPAHRTEKVQATHMGRMELLHARFFDQRFSRHFHQEFALGVIEHGALGFHYLGQDFVAQAGDINLAVPGEPHDGFAPEGIGWQYRMFYMDPALLAQAAGEMTGRAAGLPHFPTGVIHDPALAGEIQGLHMTLQSPSCDKLERDVRLLCILARLIRRHAENRPTPPRLSSAPGAVGRVMEYIQAHHDQALSLQALARVAGLSRFHLVRLFHRQVGLPPHAYLSQVRVFRAKQLLAGGMPIAEAALSVGFCDQSHLNRAFKRTLGITPGAYRNGVQEKLPVRP